MMKLNGRRDLTNSHLFIILFFYTLALPNTCTCNELFMNIQRDLGEGCLYGLG